LVEFAGIEKVSTRNFQMRLSCKYSGDNNDIAGLDVEHLVDGQWEKFDLSVNSPGFEIFVFAIFTCQHMYMRVNCAERGLLLASSEGSITAGAGADWKLETLRVAFSGKLAGGSADREHIDYIVSRMKQCPVSGNIREIPDAETTLTLA
jgi:hypothetical protein